MDRKDILEKGLLTQYLLGELTQEEGLLLESEIQKDSVLQEKLHQLESDLEKMAMENAISPPESIRASLVRAIDSEAKDTTIPLHRDSPKNAFNPMRLLVAASLAALFALTSFFFYTRWQSAQENFILAQQEQQQLQEEVQTLSNEVKVTQAMVSVLNSKDAIPFLLKGNQLSPKARAVAYVNHKNRSVWVNPQALPKLKEEETYQMWADVDGEMISMGLLPTDKELIALTYIDKAASLNITIEPKGGNDHPTVERLISNVYL
ncbi:anti-sigma factor [uncultured Muriicola sp.]|uniref:anti-sigma factor n=1 Tax=uncultured Muriicola sp. TaxID=1583102 RepID=UPI00261C0C2C|nr:anti-sigma factor [uncultured Muriicola sp.]